MRTVPLLALLALTGCATVQDQVSTSAERLEGDTRDIVNTIPDAVGTVAGAAIFGGTVSTSPNPKDYMEDNVNREGRVIYRTTRESFKTGVADIIRGK